MPSLSNSLHTPRITSPRDAMCANTFVKVTTFLSFIMYNFSAIFVVKKPCIVSIFIFFLSNFRHVCWLNSLYQHSSFLNEESKVPSLTQRRRTKSWALGLQVLLSLELLSQGVSIGPRCQGDKNNQRERAFLRHYIIELS